MTAQVRLHIRRQIDAHARELLARPVQAVFCNGCFELVDVPARRANSNSPCLCGRKSCRKAASPVAA